MTSLKEEDEGCLYSHYWRETSLKILQLCNTAFVEFAVGTVVWGEAFRRLCVWALSASPLLEVQLWGLGASPEPVKPQEATGPYGTLTYFLCARIPCNCKYGQNLSPLSYSVFPWDLHIWSSCRGTQNSKDIKLSQPDQSWAISWQHFQIIYCQQTISQKTTEWITYWLH